jgi:hypothetical protein
MFEYILLIICHRVSSSSIYSLGIHNIDNPVKASRAGSLEALVCTVRDTLLIGMSHDRHHLINHGSHRCCEQQLRFSKPLETIGLIDHQWTTFNIDYTRKYGYVNSCFTRERILSFFLLFSLNETYFHSSGIPAINEKGERLLLFIGIIDILQT